jgi:hypothetical protein
VITEPDPASNFCGIVSVTTLRSIDSQLVYRLANTYPGSDVVERRDDAGRIRGAEIPSPMRSNLPMLRLLDVEF